MRTFIIIICLVWFIQGCNSESGSKADNPVYDDFIEQRIQRVTDQLQVNTEVKNVTVVKTLDEQMTKYNTPGVSIAVINEGKIEWARGFGKRDLAKSLPVDVNTLFEAGSVSKPVFALAAMRLKQQGMIDLDADVNQYLKSWKVPKNGDWQPRITFRQLLSHTAGLTVHGFPGYLPSESVPSVPQLLRGDPPANTAEVKVNILPGTTFRYSGGGTTVAQLAITDLLNKPFPQVVKEQLFNPMGLKYSTYAQPLPQELTAIASTAYPYKNQAIVGKYHTYPEMAAAGLWTNPTELAQIIIEVQSALKGESEIFNKEIIEEMLTPQKMADFIGIGFFIDSKGDSLRFGHSGWDEGFVAEVVAFKHVGKGAVVMVNSNEGYLIRQEILRSIAKEYDWPGYISLPPEYKTDAKGLDQYIGVYKDSINEFKVEALEDRLIMTHNNQNPLTLLPLADGGFKNSDLNFKITFDDDKMNFEQEGTTSTYTK